MNDHHIGNSGNYPETVASDAFSSELGDFLRIRLMSVDFFPVLKNSFQIIHLRRPNHRNNKCQTFVLQVPGSHFI
jgi:hypothetical protein